jgi:hypothetical protein
MITEERTEATLEISGDRVIIRDRVGILRDGVEVSHYFEHREVGPDDDASGENERVQAAVRAARVE